MRRLILAFAVMAVTLVVAGGVALAVNKIGSNGPDTLRGTNGDDNLRACLVNDRVGRGGAKAASPLCRTAPCELYL
jgi:hypothetical protein